MGADKTDIEGGWEAKRKQHSMSNSKWPATAAKLVSDPPPYQYLGDLRHLSR